jgi:hypothetical protein
VVIAKELMPAPRPSAEAVAADPIFQGEGSLPALARQDLGEPDEGYTSGIKDAGRAAAEAKVRRLIDRGAESMLKDLGLKPRVFRQRVPWIREPEGGRGPRRRPPLRRSDAP